MKIAIPLSNGKLTMHFGHCESFAFLDVDEATKTITGKNELDSPPHQPGLLPKWLAEQGAQLIICGGMGQRAQELLTASGIQVIIGASPETPEQVVGAYLEGTLQLAGNICDH